MVEVKSSDAAVWWEGPLAVDADGAPNAYGPPGTEHLDALANAGQPGNWYGVVTDGNGDPVVQGPGDPCPGRYVSPTSLQDHSKARTDPLRYVDSTKIRYVSIPGNAVRDYGLAVGDAALVTDRRTGQWASAIVGDTGPRNKWGEGSVALCDALGVDDSARSGGEDAAVVVVVVFRGSSRGWPRTNEDVAQQVNELIDSVGGAQQFLQ